MFWKVERAKEVKMDFSHLWGVHREATDQITDGKQLLRDFFHVVGAFKHQPASSCLSFFWLHSLKISFRVCGNGWSLKDKKLSNQFPDFSYVCMCALLLTAWKKSGKLGLSWEKSVGYTILDPAWCALAETASSPFVCAEDQVKASELSVRPAAFQMTGTHLAGFQLSSFNLRSHQIYLEDEEYQNDIHMKDF